MGNTLVTVPGPDSAVLEGRKPKKASKNFQKCQNFRGSGTGWEIDLGNVSGALRKTPGSEKHGEEARSGPGAGFLEFGA